MKNSEIHNGLEKAEIREALSKELLRCFTDELDNTKEDTVKWASSKDPLVYCIKDAEAEIQYHTNRLEILKRRQAILLLVKISEWEEFDVSDYVAKEGEYYRNFIGTKEEYETLINSLK